MKLKLLPSLFAAQMLIAFASYGQSVEKLEAKMPGKWKLTSIMFSGPVDLNRDGIKSIDAINEYDKCYRAQLMDILQDKSGKMALGSEKDSCKVETKSFRWKIKEKQIQEATYNNGKRTVTERNALFLLMVEERYGEATGFEIIEVNKAKLKVKGEIWDGYDSTTDATLTFTLVK